MLTYRLRATLSLIAATLIHGVAQAAPVNLVTNGSFEEGLADWTHTGTFTSSTNYPAVAINYNSSAAYPVSAYGESVPAPNDASGSPDAAGTKGAYFVDDGAINESLSQLIYLLPGTYRVGFDAYAPNNGYANPHDASFDAMIAGVTLADYVVSSQPAATWLAFSGIATIVDAGLYSASFVFNTPGLGAAKDIVIDRVFVVAVPEPQTIALFGIAAGAMLIARRRRALTSA